MYFSDWQLHFVICHSAVIARKMKLLQPDRALQLCNREIGTQRLLIPHRAALARHKRSCCEQFGFEMERDRARISFLFLFLLNPYTYLTCIRFHRTTYGEPFKHQLWQRARRQ